MTKDLPPPAPGRRASLPQVVGAVLWSFFGVRKGHAMRNDEAAIRPHHAILAGIALAVLLVFGLLALVRLILHNAGV